MMVISSFVFVVVGMTMFAGLFFLVDVAKAVFTREKTNA